MKRSFWFHYNKPASRQLNKPQITVHYKGACHVVDNVVCKVDTQGRVRNSQPYWVMTGKCSSFEVKNGIATLS